MTNATNNTTTNAKTASPLSRITGTTVDDVLAGIAKEHLRMETLEERKRDALDFKEIAVWEAKRALRAAYNAGRENVTLVSPATDAAAMMACLRENLYCEAVASIAANIRGASTNDPDVDEQVRWFADQLIELLGGHDAYARLMGELGL